MLEKLKNLIKSFLIFHLINNLGYRIRKSYIYFANSRMGDQLAYSLKHIESYDFTKKQTEALMGILNYAQTNVPYYRKVMKKYQLNKGNILSNLNELPFLTKSIIREQGEEIYSEHFEKEFSYWMNTGGSTGEPLKFPASVNLEHIHQRCLYTLMNWKKNDLIVSIDGTRIENTMLDKKIFWKEGKANFPYGSFHYSTMYMDNNNMNYYINHLNIVKPSIMRGYPSGIETLAKYINSNSIKLNFELKGIYLTSEFFDSSVSELIRKSFNCPVYGQYGHSEVSVFAFTYANSLEYLCSPLYGYTEVLDEEGNQVKVGEKGEIVVTGFSNKVMPFIRYKTGDIATYGGNRNGVVKLSSLEGRSVDFIVNKDNKKVYLIGLIFGGHLKSFAKINSWQIEQNRPGIITIKIVKDQGFLVEHEKEIIHLFESVGVISVLEFVTSIPLSARGKRKFLIQNLN